MSRILIVDDDEGICRSLRIHLRQLGHDVEVAGEAATALEQAGRFRPEIVFLDRMLPDRDGLEVLGDLLELFPDAAVIVITALEDMQATIRAIRAGALDYIRKPLDLDEVVLAVEKAIRMLDRRSGTVKVFPIPDAPPRPHEILGRDRKIVEVIKQIGLLSRNRVTVLIQGESGTGKELVARAIHDSGTPGRPFVAINCSAVVPTLLESELFGHEKGAFTGALHAKPGRFELAEDGTLFLDEIGDLDLNLQAKLLRVLEEREVTHVGGLHPIPVEARIVAASNRDLASLVRDGAFREDLLYRLSVARIVLPPLREHPDDLENLALGLLARIRDELGADLVGVRESALRGLRSHSWPGNVRELENALTRAVAMSRSDVLEEIALDEAEKAADAGAPTDETGIRPLREVEADAIRSALDHEGWNITRTARGLDISPTTLRKKIADYGLARRRD